MDVARTAARLGQPAQSGGDLEVALDVARAARRLGTTQQVDCLVVEDRSEMLADPLEVAETEAEGIRIHNHLAPKRIVGDGRARGLETLTVSHAFDEHGRFNPQLLPNTERVWPCDSVIVSIGQTGALDWIRPEDGLRATALGTLQVDPVTLATSASGVFAGGDIAFGPRLIINAVADGQKAARGIHAYLQGEPPRLIRRGFFTPIARHAYPALGPVRGFLRHARQPPPLLPIERRIGVTQVELAYDEATAREQGERCLICSLNPVFDGDLCILCNGCVDVCPTDCLKLVPVRDLGGDEPLATLVGQREARTAMLLDPTRCIRCGLCAARCPTEAVRMESFRFTEELTYAVQSSDA